MYALLTARRSLLCLARATTFFATLGAAHAQELDPVTVQGQSQPSTITRIRLADDDLPLAARAQPGVAGPLRAQQRQPERQMQRDAVTLRAAHAAMLQNDIAHKQQRLAMLR